MEILNPIDYNQTRLAALNAVTAYIRLLEHQEIGPFQTLIPAIMATLKQALSAGEEESCVSALESLCDMAGW